MCPFPLVDKTPYALTLAPYSFLWLELQEGAPVPEAPVVEEPAVKRLPSAPCKCRPCPVPAAWVALLNESSEGAAGTGAAELHRAAPLVWRQVADHPTQPSLQASHPIPGTKRGAVLGEHPV